MLAGGVPVVRPVGVRVRLLPDRPVDICHPCGEAPSAPAAPFPGPSSVTGRGGKLTVVVVARAED